MQCDKCKEFFPPGFTVPKEKDENLCVFCELDKPSITYKGAEVTKKEIIEEYKIALKMIREQNEIIKQGKLEKLPSKIII